MNQYNGRATIIINTNAFSNWPAFEAELRDALTAQLAPDAAERVLVRTVRAFNAMQLQRLAGLLRQELAKDVEHYETWNQDFRAAKMKVLLMLIESFAAVETSRQP